MGVVVGALQQAVDEKTFMCLTEETAALLGRNLSEPFEIPVAVGGGRVRVCGVKTWLCE